MAAISEGPRTFFRLSPVAQSAVPCFGVRRGELIGRFDVNFWRLTPLFQHRFRHPTYPATPLGAVVTFVQYGCSALATDKPVGVPILRMNNIQDDGWDLHDVKSIVLSDEEKQRYLLEPGDVLFNRTNSKELVGKCAVFAEAGEWVFASYLIRVRLRTTDILPQFAADFLNSSAGRLQIDRLSRQIIGMTNINAEELRQIRLPLPPQPKQCELLSLMNAAREARWRKHAEADTLLSELDGFILGTLGLTITAEPKKTFAIHTRELTSALNPDRYRGLQLEKHLSFKSTLFDVGSLVS